MFIYHIVTFPPLWWSSDSTLSFAVCLIQEPQWWQWQRSTQTTPPPIMQRCATTLSGSHQTNRPRTCSTSMQKKATLSPSFPPRYLTERWVHLANPVCVCVCVSLCIKAQSLLLLFCSVSFSWTDWNLPLVTGISEIQLLVCPPQSVYTVWVCVIVCALISQLYVYVCFILRMGAGASQRAGAEVRRASFHSPRLTGARQRDDCFFSRVTNARTSIGFAGGRGILAVVRHLAHSLIEVIHTHPLALVVSNKLGWKPPIRNCWNRGS